MTAKRPTHPIPEAPALMTADAVASMCAIDPVTVRRRSDARLMPPPVRIGRLTRWRRDAILAWIAAGCPRCDERAG
jgi:predicted DNA-binding transcriptional regulator AlpA